MQWQWFRKSHLYVSLVAIFGYMLSPLSWWNDLFVNVPLAYLFALPFSLLYEPLYLPTFILGYWLSNLLGFMLLHYAGSKLMPKHYGQGFCNRNLLIILLYTMLIVILVWFGVLPSATELTQYFDSRNQ